MNKADKQKAVQRVLDMIVLTISEADEFGAPGGHIYASLMAALGISFETYNGIMNLLVLQGRIEKKGDRYFIPKKG